MTPALRWVCVVCVVLGGTLARASLQAEFGVSIHPAFSSSVYIGMDPYSFEDPLDKEEQVVGQNQAAVCEILNTTDSGPDLHQVKTLPRKFFSFFVKPEPSFKKLVFKLSLEPFLYISSDKYSDEDITLTLEDLTHSEDSQWTHVRVEHYQHHRRRRLDRHSFKVSFANKTVSCITHDSWLWKVFKGFTVFAEGGATFLFNCAPGDVDEAPVAGYGMYSLLVMAGFVIVATALLAALCLVWVYLQYQRKEKHTSVLPMKYPMYNEFDEEVLERIKQKVEALRKGETVANPDTVVVSYPPRQENLYVLDASGYRGVEGVSPEEHHYEDIQKYYKHLYITDNEYQKLDGDDGSNGNVTAVDNIYESLPCSEDYLEKREDDAKASSRYVTS